MDYNVKIEIFEGPMDLLLYLIKKNEVDIYDIPIATITEQYLEYIELIKSLNLDIAGEFLLMAATLIYIKSRMLLPMNDEIEEIEEEADDPRLELARRLVEYKRYKDAAVQFTQRSILGRDVFKRGMETVDRGDNGACLENLSLFHLIGALKGVMEKAPAELPLFYSAEKLTVIDKMGEIMDILNAERSAAFRSLVSSGAGRAEIVTIFIAILELASMQMIRIFQGKDGCIRLYLPNLEEETSLNNSQRA